MGALRRLIERLGRAVRAFESDQNPVQGQRINVRVMLERDEVDGGWVAEAPAFPGAFAQGETEREALEAITAVLADVIVLRFEEEASRAQPTSHTGTDNRSYDLALSV